VNDVPPSALSYTGSPYIYTKGTAIAPLTPVVSGGAVISYSISPALPAGLAISTATGSISGTPAALAAQSPYTITAANSGGSTTAAVQLTVNDAAPSGLVYSGSPYVFVRGSGAITRITPGIGGGAATSFAISPALPAAIGFDPATGSLFGTPAVL